MRFQEIRTWAAGQGAENPVALAGDASTRDFYRVRTTTGSLILVDAPPATNPNNIQYLRLSAYFRELGLHVPEIVAVDMKRGFFLMEDLGDRQYLHELRANPSAAERLYTQASAVLLRLWEDAQRRHAPVPNYTQARLDAELQIFEDWFVAGLLRDKADPVWPRWRRQLLAVIAQQPSVCVHRDFHSRNLMALAGSPQPGIVDYQDALWGPLTYDIVSLLQDCYISWPIALRDRWREAYRRDLREAGGTYSAEVFRCWCDHTACQRHLKAIGIFARLHVRDGRADWLADIPRTMDHVLEFSRQWSPYRGLGEWLETRLLPAFEVVRASASKAVGVSS